MLVHEIDQIDEIARLAAAAAAVRNRKARPAQLDAASAAGVQAAAEELAEANAQLLRLREKQRTQELKLDEQAATSERMQLRVAALAQAANVAHAAFRTLMGSMERDELATLPAGIRRSSMDAVEQPRQASELARAVAGGVSKRVDRLVRQGNCNQMHRRCNPMHLCCNSVHTGCNPTHPRSQPHAPMRAGARGRAAAGRGGGGGGARARGAARGAHRKGGGLHMHMHVCMCIRVRASERETVYPPTHPPTLVPTQAAERMEAALEAAGGDDDRALAAAQRARRARVPGGEDDASVEWRSRRDQLITEMAEAWQRPLAAMGLLQPSHSAPRGYMGLQPSPSVPLLDVELAASLPSQLVPMAVLQPDHALQGRSFFHSPASPSPPRTAGARVAYGSPGSSYGDYSQTRRHATALQPQPPAPSSQPHSLRP